ncbi:MAG: hypothetical protein U5R46_17555 [Gammaproteobacteria bacterium]|nr:hypothetical protein [Gammaproteobacteria bacterium]
MDTSSKVRARRRIYWLVALLPAPILSATFYILYESTKFFACTPLMFDSWCPTVTTAAIWVAAALACYGWILSNTYRYCRKYEEEDPEIYRKEIEEILDAHGGTQAFIIGFFQGLVFTVFVMLAAGVASDDETPHGWYMTGGNFPENWSIRIAKSSDDNSGKYSIVLGITCDASDGALDIVFNVNHSSAYIERHGIQSLSFGSNSEQIRVKIWINDQLTFDGFGKNRFRDLSLGHINIGKQWTPLVEIARGGQLVLEVHDPSSNETVISDINLRGIDVTYANFTRECVLLHRKYDDRHTPSYVQFNRLFK